MGTEDKCAATRSATIVANRYRTVPGMRGPETEFLPCLIGAVGTFNGSSLLKSEQKNPQRVLGVHGSPCCGRSDQSSAFRTYPASGRNS